MPKKAGIVFISMGAVLILSALLLFWHNEEEDRQAGRQAAAALEKMQARLEAQAELQNRGQGIDDPTDHGQDAAHSAETTVHFEKGTLPETEDLAETGDGEQYPAHMPVMEIDGYGYIGRLVIPALDLALPVMSDWDYDRLKIAPCRQFGSTATDDLVVAGHNYDTFFARLGSLQSGDAVFFTDMNGWIHEYAVCRVAVLDPGAVDEVKDSGCDLVLYTCTESAADRIVVFCDRAKMAAGEPSMPQSGEKEQYG